jgi:hypothetical protein
VVPLPSAPTSTQPNAGLRGAAAPLGFFKGSGPTKGQGFAADYLSGPALGKTGAAAVAHAIDLGAGTTIAALGPSLVSDVRHPIARIQEARKRGLVTTEQASTALSARLARTGVTGAVPKNFRIPSIDLVGVAGAATNKKALTLAELKALEAAGQNVGLAPAADKAFTAMALKRGWSSADLDGVSAGRKIDMAYSSPPMLPLRLLGNFASGVGRLGTLPAGLEGAGREIAAGRGLKVAQALGEGLYSELPVVGKHPVLQTAQADPFGFISQFAGAGKTVGSVAALGRAGRAATAREFESAASKGFTINRGPRERNAYTAVGQLASDKAAATVPAIARHAEGKVVNTLVRRVLNQTKATAADLHRDYAHALHIVGDQRAAELLAFQHAAGEPGRLAKFYARQPGEAAAGQAQALAHIAETTQHLSPADEGFLKLHAELAKHTSEAYVASEKFSDTAMRFRQYSPLIRMAAHDGDPHAQSILTMRDRLYGTPSTAGTRTAKSEAQMAELERQARKHEQAFGRAERIANNKPQRPPAGAPPETMAEWRSARAKWETQARTARTRMATHRATADRLNARIDELGGRVRKAQEALSGQDHAALQGAYAHAVDEFITSHAERGGIEPSRVAYTQAPQAYRSPFARSGARLGFKTPTGRQPLETGAAFESGKYLIDPHAPLKESLAAQHAQVSNLLHDETIKQLGRRAEAGDERPSGWAYVSDKNLATARRTVHDLPDNPVTMDAYRGSLEKQHGFLAKILTPAMRDTPTGERVPAGEHGWFVPKGALDQILAYTQPPSRNAYDQMLTKYQRILVGYRPSTVFNNAIGSLPLAMLSGAGPKAFHMAWRSMRDKSLAPPVLFGRGVAGSFAHEATGPISAASQFLRRGSQWGEDFSRLAAYWGKAGKGMAKRAKALEMTGDEYARALANGTVDRPLQEKWIDHAADFLSDQITPTGKIGRQVGRGILFHRWVGHIAKLLLVTLPLNHPRRLEILNSLAAYGDQYRQEHGVWPDWYSTYLPLFQHVERLGPGGVPQVFTKSFNTAGVNPFATLNQYSGAISSNDSTKEIARGILNPFAQSLYNEVVGPPAKSPAGTSKNFYTLAQLVRSIPGVTVIRPQGGMNPDSIPFLRERQRVYSTGYPAWGGGKAAPLPYAFRPGARPQGGLLGIGERYLLGGVSDVPAAGPVTAIAQRKQIAADAARARAATRAAARKAGGWGGSGSFGS